jgi:SAM-dependent methyltransferase
LPGIRKAVGRVYWGVRDRVLRSTVAGIYRRASDPLWLSRRCLTRSISRHREFACGRLLDVGCGGQPYRPMLTGVDRYVGVDLPWPGTRADVYGDATRLPFADASFDTVLCNQVLEHISEPHELLAETARVLRPGGVLILTTPQVWGLHHEPYDFYRYTPYGLTHLAEAHGLAVTVVAPTCGMWATLAQRLADTVVHGYMVDRPLWTQRLMGLCLNPFLVAAYAIDRLFGMRGDTLDNLIVARKPPTRGAEPVCPTSNKHLPTARSSLRAA